MRDPNRIDPFLQELGTIWKTQCPDWRFGQFLINVFGGIPGGSLWLLEEDKMIETVRNYFKSK